MTCDRCEENRALGAKFCSNCGEQLTDPCERCEEFRLQGAMYCPICGRRVNSYYTPVYAPKKSRIGFIFVAGLIAAAQGLLIMLVEIITGWSRYGTMSDATDGKSYPIFIITPHIQDLFDINDTAMRVVFILEMITVTACFLAMILLAVNRYLKSGNDLSALRETSAYEVPVLTGLMIFFETVVMVIMLMAGFDFGTSDTGVSGSMMFSLLHASVYEEILSRLCMIGLPCLIVALVLRRKDSPKWKYLFGGAEYEHWMLIFVIFSATMFGLAHLDNWDTWKFFPTFVFGILTGYVFLKYGLYATISMHFINDYLMAGEWLCNAQAMLILGILAVGFCAMPCLVDYAKRLWSYLKTLNSLRQGS